MNVKVITEKVKVVKTERYITVNGVKFEATDLFDTLDAMNTYSGDIYLKNNDMIQLFKKLKVIEYEGSKEVSIIKGRNFKKFRQLLQPAFESLNLL